MVINIYCYYDFNAIWQAVDWSFFSKALCIVNMHIAQHMKCKTVWNSNEMESNKNLKPFITKNENDKGQRKKELGAKREKHNRSNDRTYHLKSI